MIPTYKELNDDFLLTILCGWSAVALRKEINDLAFSEHSNEPISNKHAAEVNRVAGFRAVEIKKKLLHPPSFKDPVSQT